MADVRLQEGETVENALRRFKRQVIQENIIGEVKRHSFYLKPGQKLRVKQALARKRNRKKARSRRPARRSRVCTGSISPTRASSSRSWTPRSNRTGRSGT